MYDAVARGSPLLQNVTIDMENLYSHTESLEILMEDIVRSFVACPNLQVLDVRSRIDKVFPRLGTVANICHRIRFKRAAPLYVHVLRRVYLR